MKKIILFLINTYQKISGFLEKEGYVVKKCRFYPSCSEYSKIAFENKSFFEALKLSFKRFVRCGPHTDGGYDPVPGFGLEKKDL